MTAALCRHARASIVFVALVATALACGCKKPPPAEEQPTTNASAAASAKPVDHVAPGELLEGAETAFGVKLPRAAHVDGAFSDVVFVTIRAPTEPIVGYFRARVRDGAMRKGERSATFEHVKVPGKPGLELGIVVREISMQECRVEIRDTTPMPQPDLPSEEARWRALGMKPGGQPLDPTKVE